MPPAQAVALVAGATFLVNLPFGYWRAGLRKLSPAWFLAIHAPVPLTVGMRFALNLPFRWVTLPVFVAAYFSGQFLGSRLGRRGVAPGLVSGDRDGPRT
jgi:hypothetical protein